jgi:hypothetical protein
MLYRQSSAGKQAFYHADGPWRKSATVARHLDCLSIDPQRRLYAMFERQKKPSKKGTFGRFQE